MAGLKCPRCGLFSPESAERCDCGHQFKSQSGTTGRSVPQPEQMAFPSQVSIVDVNMPFGSMVVFMVKWAIASIPALLILIALGALVSIVLGGSLAGLVRLFGR